MAKEQTAKSRYPSRYSPGGFVTAAQYIIELTCENQANYRKTELPVKFWNLPEWNNTFKRYLRQVQVLLKQYDEKAIIRAIQKNKICTLFSKVLDDRIEQEEKLLKRENLKNSLEHDNGMTYIRPTEIILPEKTVEKNKLSMLDE